MASNFFKGLGMSSQSTPVRPKEPDQKRKHVTSPESNTNRCARCNNDLRNEKVCCHTCSLNFCIRCAGMNKNAYELLASGALDDFSYTCKSCKNTRPTLINIDRKLTKSIENQEKRIHALEDRMDKMSIETKNTVQKEFSQLKQEMENEFEQRVNTMIDKKTEELEDRRRRELNVVIFNLQEGNSSVNIENKHMDEVRVCELADELGIENLEIETSYRLGKKVRGKTRVLKIVLKNRRQRKRLLESGREIKQKASEVYKEVVVAKDLTTEQREQKKEKLRNKREGNIMGTARGQDRTEDRMDVTLCPQNSQNKTSFNLTHAVIDPFMSETIVDQHEDKEVADIDADRDKTIIVEKTIIGGIPQNQTPTKNPTEAVNSQRD